MLQRTLRLAEEAILPEEEEAILLVWESRGHSRDEPISEDEALEILAQIRARAASIEAHALRVLTRTTSESRRYPRRHMVFAIVIVLPIAAALIALVIFFFGRPVK